MGKNQISLILGLVSAIVIIGWTVYVTNPVLLDDTEPVTCMMMFPEFVFISEEHCGDVLNKCHEEYLMRQPITPVSVSHEALIPCFEENGIMRK